MRTRGPGVLVNKKLEVVKLLNVVLTSMVERTFIQGGTKKVESFTEKVKGDKKYYLWTHGRN